MNAIPTDYHGYRCRSRLEARWIVFFEHMGIDFLYEPEGFEFEDGTRYLPDFYLPQIRFWAEVKPAEFTAEELHKAESLVRASHRNLLMLVGPPDFRNYTGLTFDSGEVTDVPYILDIFNYSRAWKEARLFGQPDELSEEDASKRYKNAVYDARGARFEDAA